MSRTKSKLKSDILACLNRVNELVRQDTYDRHKILSFLSRVNSLVREYSYETRGANATIVDAIHRVANDLGTTPEKIRVKSNEAHIVIQRQICQYVLRHALNVSYPEIANATGLEDHTTVIYSCRKIEKLRAANEEFDKKIRRLIGAFLDRNTVQDEEEIVA